MYLLGMRLLKQKLISLRFAATHTQKRGTQKDVVLHHLPVFPVNPKETNITAVLIVLWNKKTIFK